MPATTPPTPEHIDRMTAPRGWFQRQLWLIESMLNGRWAYWQAICLNGRLGDLPEWAIPQLSFSAHVDGSRPACTRRDELAATDSGKRMLDMAGGAADAKKHAVKVFEKALDHGRHRLQDLLDWWLWGFGSNRIERRPELSDRAAVAMYHELQLYRLIANPADWGSHISLDILGGSKSGTAWFPTPMSIAEMMARMTFETAETDTRTLSVNDPCVGTGVFLLVASNYSLDLSCQDIDPLMCSWTEFVGWLYMPWLVWGNKQMIREFREPREQPRSLTVQPSTPAPDKPSSTLAPAREFADAGPLFALNP